MCSKLKTLKNLQYSHLVWHAISHIAASSLPFTLCSDESNMSLIWNFENFITINKLQMYAATVNTPAKARFSFLFTTYPYISIISFIFNIYSTVGRRRCHWWHRFLIVSIWFIVQNMNGTLLWLLWCLLPENTKLNEFRGECEAGVWLEKYLHLYINRKKHTHYRAYLGAIRFMFSSDLFSEIRPASSNLLSFDCLMCS